MDKAEEAFSKIKAKFETEIKTKDGNLVIKHDLPISDEDIAIFKDYTTEEVETLVLGTGFTKRQY